MAKETGFIINNNNNIIIIPNKQFGQISRRTHPRAHRPPHSFTTRQRLVFHSALEQLGRWLLTKACSLLMLLSEDQHGFVTAAHTPSSLAKIYPILLRLYIYIYVHTGRKTSGLHSKLSPTNRAFRASSESRRQRLGMPTKYRRWQPAPFVTGAPPSKKTGLLLSTPRRAWSERIFRHSPN